MRPSQERIQHFITLAIAREGQLEPADISVQQSFFELGLDSISAIFLLDLVEKEFSIELQPLDFWDYPTIESFSQYIHQSKLP